MVPLYIIAGWLVKNACVDYARFRSIKPGNPALNQEILHLFLRENIKKTYLRTMAEHVPDDDLLPEIKLYVEGEHQASLNANLPKSGRDYYSAYLKYRGKRQKVKVHYVGDNYFHWHYKQKSWRVKTKKDELIDGIRKINLKNPVYITTFYESLAQDMAKELGLISSITFPIRFYLNDLFTGVYMFQEPIGESLMRRSGRMPGSVYSGDGAPRNPETGVSRLWEDGKYWEKSASRSLEEESFRDDIDLYTKMAKEDDMLEFYRLARTYLDNEAYAKYLSLDNITGAEYHDYHHNNKVYFDPIEGKFVPVAWDSSLWGYHRQRHKSIDIALNPLLYRWKSVPEFDAMRLKMLYWLITRGPFNEEKMLVRIDDFNRGVRPSLAADVYRDMRLTGWTYAARLKISPQPVMSFTMKEYDEDIKRFREDVVYNLEFLKEYMAQSRLKYLVEENNNIYTVKILASGNVGRHLSAIKIKGGGLGYKGPKIYRDTNRNFALDSGDVLIGRARCRGDGCDFDLDENLYTGYRKVKRTTDLMLRGTYSMIPSPLIYSYLIDPSGGTVETLDIISENVITGRSLPAEDSEFSTEDTASTVSLHPWEVPPDPEPMEVVLGPGEIEVSEDLIYPEHVTVRIMPGTTFRLGPGVSVFIYGKVVAQGSFEAPISFLPSDGGEPWGSFVLQGKAASGSVFEYVNWSGGSTASRNLVKYSGMVSFYDNSDVTVLNCRVGSNFIGDDSMHIAHNRNFLVQGCVFEGALNDALDVDISDGKVVASHFRLSGNDALDLMTSDVRVSRSTFERAGDKGISVGENTKLYVSESLFTECVKGLEVKDSSLVMAEDIVINGSEVAINLYKKNWRYSDGGRVQGKKICMIRSKENITADENSDYDINEVGDSETCPFDWPVELKKEKVKTLSMWKAAR
jgi:hypothetical protein